MKTLSPFFPDPDPNIETEVRAILMNHYAPIYKARVNSFLDTSLAIEPFAGRFDFLRSSISEDIFNQHAAILISGFGMGSEMIMARRFGFVKVFGVEVEQILVEATKMRLSKYTDMHPSFYEGKYLPFEDGLFNVVASGHVIEHTMDPRLYLKEIFRVLIPGGYLLLEFPHRYHMIELHTSLPSLEWMPRELRNLILRVLSSKISPLSTDVKSRYESIYTTNLQQISMGGVLSMLRSCGYATQLINKQLPAPGIIRCVIKRN